jgi:hypothetical protein
MELCRSRQADTGGISVVIKEAIELFKEHQKGSVKKSTLKSYGKFMDYFLEKFST